MTIRSPKHNSQGYTLLEMLTVIGVVGILMAMGIPSLLALNKPLRSATVQLKSHLSLIRSKAISRNQAYRIRPMFPTRAEYTDKDNEGIPGKFIVEYAANCSVTAMGAANNGWERASQFDLNLPPRVGITDINNTVIAPNPPISNDLDWNDGSGNLGICFDNRGLASRSLDFIIKDFQSNNKAKITLFKIGRVGSVWVSTYDKNNNVLLDSQIPPQPLY